MPNNKCTFIIESILVCKLIGTSHVWFCSYQHLGQQLPCRVQSLLGLEKSLLVQKKRKNSFNTVLDAMFTLYKKSHILSLLSVSKLLTLSVLNKKNFTHGHVLGRTVSNIKQCELGFSQPKGFPLLSPERWFRAITEHLRPQQHKQLTAYQQ